MKAQAYRKALKAIRTQGITPDDAADGSEEKNKAFAGGPGNGDGGKGFFVRFGKDAGS